MSLVLLEDGAKQPVAVNTDNLLFIGPAAMPAGKPGQAIPAVGLSVAFFLNSPTTLVLRGSVREIYDKIHGVSTIDPERRPALNDNDIRRIIGPPHSTA